MFKENKMQLKVAVGILILLGVFVGMYIGANNIAFVAATNEGEVESLEATFENITPETVELENEGIADDALDLGFIPRIAQSGSNFNQFFLFDPITGEIVASYEFAEYERIFVARDLGSGYYAVHVGEESLLSRQIWSGIYDDMLNDTNSEVWEKYAAENYPEESESALNYRVIIFDQDLNVIDTLPGETESTGLNLWGSALRFEDGILFVYDTQSILGEEGVSFGAFSIIPAHLRRLNVNTGEIEILFEVDNSMHTMEFIGEHHILVDRLIVDNESISGFRGVRSVIDLETAEVIDLERIEILEGDDVIAYLEAQEINLEAWESFGNSLERLETQVWDTEALERFNIDLEKPDDLDRLIAAELESGLLRFSVFSNGIVFFYEDGEIVH